MQQTVATFVSGLLQKDFFGDENIPTVILTTETDKNIFSSIGLVNSTGPNSGLFKIFSRKPLTTSDLDRVFERYDASSVKEKTWLAYPTFSPPEKFTPFVLDKGLFYVNAIETGASAVEMLAIAAKNAALLVAEASAQKKGDNNHDNLIRKEL